MAELTLKSSIMDISLIDDCKDGDTLEDSSVVDNKEEKFIVSTEKQADPISESDIDDEEDNSEAQVVEVPSDEKELSIEEVALTEEKILVEEFDDEPIINDVEEILCNPVVDEVGSDIISELVNKNEIASEKKDIEASVEKILEKIETKPIVIEVHQGAPQYIPVSVPVAAPAENHVINIEKSAEDNAERVFLEPEFAGNTNPKKDNLSSGGEEVVVESEEIDLSEVAIYIPDENLESSVQENLDFVSCDVSRELIDRQFLSNIDEPVEGITDKDLSEFENTEMVVDATESCPAEEDLDDTDEIADCLSSFYKEYIPSVEEEKNIVIEKNYEDYMIQAILSEMVALRGELDALRADSNRKLTAEEFFGTSDKAPFIKDEDADFKIMRDGERINASILGDDCFVAGEKLYRWGDPYYLKD